MASFFTVSAFCAQPVNQHQPADHQPGHGQVKQAAVQRKRSGGACIRPGKGEGEGGAVPFLEFLHGLSQRFRDGLLNQGKIVEKQIEGAPRPRQGKTGTGEQEDAELPEGRNSG